MPDKISVLCMAGAVAALVIAGLYMVRVGQSEPVAKADTDEPPGLETATFGSGCFWCTEAVFLQLKGVYSVVSGYSGGQVVNPTYEQVCGGATGHAEVVQIKFD